MAGYKGRLFLVQVEDAQENFVTVAGGRTKEFTINGETVDSTHDQDGVHRSLVQGVGIRSCAISMSGIYIEDDKLSLVEDLALSGEHKEMRIISEEGTTYTGLFEVVNFQRAGEYNGVETFNFSAESAGAITRGPAP